MKTTPIPCPDDANSTDVGPDNDLVPAEFIRAGCRALLADEPRLAIDSFRTALANTQPTASLLTHLGIAFCLQKQWAEAADAFRQALNLDTQHANAWRNLSVVQHVTGKSSAAVESLNEYLALEPDDGEALFNLGLLYRELGQPAESAAALRSAVACLDLTVPENAGNLAVAHYLLGDRQNSVAAAEEALERDPDYLPARYQLGVSLLTLGRYAEAIDALQTVLTHDPEYPQALENLAVAYNSAGQAQDALGILEPMYSASNVPSPSLMLNLGIAMMDSGRARDAVALFRRVLYREDAPEQVVMQSRQFLSLMSATDDSAERSDNSGRPAFEVRI